MPPHSTFPVASRPGPVGDRRLLALPVVLAAFVGCQCFVPVSEQPSVHPDAGPSADAGTAPPPECRTAADCAPFVPDGGFSWCQDRAASCIAGRCLQECGGGRTCEVLDGGACLACVASPTRCLSASCGAPRTCSLSVESSTCPGMEPFVTTWTVTRAPDCHRDVRREDGGLVGRWYDVSFSEGVGVLDGLPGPCTIHLLPTNAPRTEWACPGCNFTEMGCE